MTCARDMKTVEGKSYLMTKRAKAFKNEASKALTADKSPGPVKWFGVHLIGLTDMAAETATWNKAYQEGLQKYKTESEAIGFADQTVQVAHPVRTAAELTDMLKDPNFQKAAALLYEENRDRIKSQFGQDLVNLRKGVSLGKYMIGMSAILASAIGTDDDDETGDDGWYNRLSDMIRQETARIEMFNEKSGYDQTASDSGASKDKGATKSANPGGPPAPGQSPLSIGYMDAGSFAPGFN